MATPMPLSPELIEILIRAAVTVGEDIVLAILHAIHGGDVSAVEELTKTGLEEPAKIAMIDAALERSQAAKAGA